MMQNQFSVIRKIKIGRPEHLVITSNNIMYNILRQLKYFLTDHGILWSYYKLRQYIYIYPQYSITLKRKKSN